MLDDIVYANTIAALINGKIRGDFTDLNESEIEKFFDKFQKDKGTLRFIEYYNKTVLDKEKISFGEFKSRWGIQGMTREFYSYFDENYDKIKEEITSDKNIRAFFEKYCSKERKEGTFCSKLFHTFLPSEFPPIDAAIRRRFCIQNEDLIASVLIVKKSYDLFSKENPNAIKRIRKVLSKEKFAYLRSDELSDMRILDMYYWFKENRNK